ncbi:MAG TPA: FG-GAP-like repeat-containing protein [Vicinamibacterales bacterium]|nr:FG-GAP-like repeat-containing protein [Vicinamibacterales bacterium]
MICPSHAARTAIVTSLSIVAVLGLALPARADWSQRQKVASTPRGVGAQFGNAVAVSGNTMVIGARFDSTTANQAGAALVYVLTGTTWTQQAKLLASDGALGDKFGYSVAIREDTFVVGAYNDDAPTANSGSAYVFVRNGPTWTQQQKLTAGDGTMADEFGNAVAIDGDVVAVGAHFADLRLNAAAGAVYVFHRSGTAWGLTQKLLPIPGPFPVPAGPLPKVPYSPVLGDSFGESLAMSAGKLVVGASTSDIPETSAGAVYVFAGSGGTYALQQKLTILGGTNGDIFGCSVAIYGNTLVGGAREDTTIIGKPAYGAAYVFEFGGGTWTLQGKLIAADGAAFDRFGWSVAVDKDMVAVGAREDDTTVGPDAGSAYVFVRSGTTWTQQQKLAPTDTFNGDRFGASVAFSGETSLLVGAAEKNLTGPNGQGAVYAFASSIKSKQTGFDYDGDGKADMSIFRLSNGQCWYQQSADNMVRSTTFGSSTDKPVPADYDGDGKTDIAVYRSTGEWFILRSSNLTFYSIPFGISTNIPSPGDFDGDGMADIAVFRPSDSSFFAVPFGANGDIPVPADYDGDGKADFAVFRPDGANWFIQRSTQGILIQQFGTSGDVPTPAAFVR